MAEKVTDFSELPEAEITGYVMLPDNTEALALRVNVGGQDHPIALRLDAMPNHNASDQEEAGAVDRIANGMAWLAKHQVSQIEATRDQTEMQSRHFGEIIALLKKQSR